MQQKVSKYPHSGTHDIGKQIPGFGRTVRKYFPLQKLGKQSKQK